MRMARTTAIVLNTDPCAIAVNADGDPSALIGSPIRPPNNLVIAAAASRGIATHTKEHVVAVARV